VKITKAKAEVETEVNTLPLQLKTAVVPIIGTTPLSFGRHHEESKKGPNESADAYEKRTFLEKIHHDREGNVFVPPMMLSKSLAAAPAFLKLGTIPETKGATYTKFFLSGLSIEKPMYVSKPAQNGQRPLQLTLDDARHESFFVGPPGIGKGNRIVHWFGTFDQWEGTFECIILNADILTEEIFERVVVAAGIFTGIGRFRPAVGGYYGRFRLNGKIQYTPFTL
jgi:hypothetical protein